MCITGSVRLESLSIVLWTIVRIDVQDHSGTLSLSLTDLTVILGCVIVC